MKVYIIQVTVSYDKSTYVDSVWEDVRDAYNHIERCRERGIFDEDFEPEVKSVDVYKHNG